MVLAIFATQTLLRDLSEVAEALTPWIASMTVVSGFGLWLTIKEQTEEPEEKAEEAQEKDWSKEPFLMDEEDWTEEQFQEFMEEYKK